MEDIADFSDSSDGTGAAHADRTFGDLEINHQQSLEWHMEVPVSYSEIQGRSELEIAKYNKQILSYWQKVRKVFIQKRC